MLLLVDGTNVVMRYASAMIERDTEPTCDDVAKVLRSVTKAIVECAQHVGASYLIVALDSAVDSWRRDRYPPYKAQRTVSTTVWSNRLYAHLAERGVRCVRSPGFEADDVLATLVARNELHGRESFVLSADSDLLQCASLLTRVVQFGKSGVEPRFVVRNMAWIGQKYDLPSGGLLVLYKALVGETGDNVPGVAGIGPVKARKLLALAQTADDLTKLLKGEVEVEAFRLALELVTLRTDVPLDPIAPADCRFTPQRMILA